MICKFGVMAGGADFAEGLRKTSAEDAGRARAKFLRGMCLSLEKYLRRGTAQTTEKP